MRILVLTLVFAAACAQHVATPTPTPSTIANRVERRIELRHGLMTFVMDSPAGQRDKARAAVVGSALAARIAELGYDLAIEFDRGAGDDVVVVEHGRELARMPLHDVAAGTITGDVERALRR